MFGIRIVHARAWVYGDSGGGYVVVSVVRRVDPVLRVGSAHGGVLARVWQ